MNNKIGKSGVIVGIVNSSIYIAVATLGLIYSITYLTVFHDPFYFSGFIGFLIITLILILTIGVISLVYNVRYFKTGEHKTTAGVLNILTLFIIGIVGGILILCSNDE